MGTFNWPLRISSMDGQQSREIEATVDTGAAYTTLPAPLLRELGVDAEGKAQVPARRRSAGRYGLRTGVGHRGRRERYVTIVVFGEDDAPSAAGGIHPRRPGPGGGPGRTAIGPDPPHHVLGSG